MLKLNCLINDTRAAQDIKDAIEVLAGERSENNQSVQFPAIYNELRKAGLEIDAESAGSLYNELYGGYNDVSLSTLEQIVEYVGKDVVNQQNAIIDAMAGPQVKEKQIGNLPPEKQVATMIAKMFQEATFGTTKNVNSVMKQMEILVSRAAKSLLPPTKQKPGKSLFENLTDFFETEKVEFQTLSGSTNTLKTLHDAVKAEVENYLDTATDTLSDEDAEDLRQQWETYTDGFIQSNYDIMLGKSDQNKLLNESLKQVEIDGLQVVDVNGNVKWSVLMEDNNPTKIADGVKTLFEQGVKDESGNITKYSREEAGRIGEYFQRLYEKKLASVVQQKIGNQRAKNISAKNIISDFIKDRGFINLVKDKNGNLLLTQANWEDAIRYMIRKTGDRVGIDVAVEKLREFLSSQGKENGTKKFTKKQIDIIESEFRNVVAAKLVPGTAAPGAMDRLIALNNLNGGKAFEESTQTALNNVLGVSGLDQQTINEIQRLTEASESIVRINPTDDSTSDDPKVNRGAYAFQAKSQIERRIKEIIRENKIDRSTSQRIVKYIGDIMNASSTSLLINPGNFGENILTAFGTNIGESLNMLFTHPKLFTKFGGDFWTAFGSHISGGVANEVIADQDITSDVQTGERLRFRSIAKEFENKGWVGALSVLLKLPAYSVSIVARTIMNSVDAGFNSSILRKKAVTSMYKALISQGMTSNEVLDAMSAVLKTPKATSNEIDQLNNEIMAKLKSVGLHPTKFDKEQNRRDLMLSLYEDALGQAAMNNGNRMSARQITEAVKALIDSSQSQAKVLTGKKEIPSNGLDVINRLIYSLATGVLKFQRNQFREQTTLEQEGDLKGAARAQAYAEIWKNTIARFAGGIANFLALATTATPLGYLTAYSLSDQKTRLLKINPHAADISKAEPGDIRKYAEYHHLMRSMILRATMGTLAIGGFITAKLTGDDDDEDDNSFIANLMQTQSGRRLLQKYLPLGMNVAAFTLYDVKDKKMNTKMERLIDLIGNTTGQTYDSWSTIKTSMQRAKTQDDAWKAAATYFGSAVPTLNINQAEQIEKFTDVLNSAVNEKGISEVKRNEKISREIYKQAEDVIDVIGTNGAIEAMGRIFDKEEKFNRFIKK